MKKIIIIAVAVMLLAGIGVGAMLFLQEKPPPAEGEAVVEPVAADPVYFGLDPDFVIAFQQPKTARFLKAAVEVMARDDDVIEDIKLHMPAIRDSVVMLLSTKEETALMSREGKEQLRAEILAEVQAVLEKNTGNPGIEAVYFTNFVMQ